MSLLKCWGFQWTSQNVTCYNKQNGRVAHSSVYLTPASQRHWIGHIQSVRSPQKTYHLLAVQRQITILQPDHEFPLLSVTFHPAHKCLYLISEENQGHSLNIFCAVNGFMTIEDKITQLKIYIEVIHVYGIDYICISDPDFMCLNY